MRFLSICSGIDAPTVAWSPLGWEPIGYSEIEPFCCEVLAHRHGASRPIHMPDPSAPGISIREQKTRTANIKAVQFLPASARIPNYGDFTKITETSHRPDVLVGGTPCQSFSVAGKRLGLDDPRGNLALEFALLAKRLRPRWIVWENVNGVRSSWSDDPGTGNETSDFDTFLKALADCGYGFAYRVFDAQYDGLAQRRERVFVVGYLGDWRPPAAVLFERESLRRDTAPGRETGQEVATGVAPCFRGSGPGGGRVGGIRADRDAVVSMCLNGKGGSGRIDGESETFIPFHGAQITSAANRGDPKPGDPSPTLNGDPRLMIAHTLRADGFDASEDGTGRGSPLVITGALCANGRAAGSATGQDAYSGTIVAAFLPGQGSAAGSVGYREDQSPTLRSGEGSAKNIGISNGQAVRRLTPVEWARLMGFPDYFCYIPRPKSRTVKPDELTYLIHHNLPAFQDKRQRWRTNIAADGPMYRALGNSIAIPCLRWIGQRIQSVDNIIAANTK